MKWVHSRHTGVRKQMTTFLVSLALVHSNNVHERVCVFVTDTSLCVRFSFGHSWINFYMLKEMQASAFISQESENYAFPC